MISAKTIQIIQECIRRTGRSLLQYIEESDPWISSPRDQEIVDKLYAMAAAEQSIAGELAELLARNQSYPKYLGSYPMHFTTMNFLAVNRLLKLLTEHQKQDIDALASDIALVSEPEAKELLNRLLSEKKAHLQAIADLKQTPAATESTAS